MKNILRWETEVKRIASWVSKYLGGIEKEDVQQELWLWLAEAPDGLSADDILTGLKRRARRVRQEVQRLTRINGTIFTKLVNLHGGRNLTLVARRMITEGKEHERWLRVLDEWDTYVGTLSKEDKALVNLLELVTTEQEIGERLNISQQAVNHRKRRIFDDFKQAQKAKG